MKNRKIAVVGTTIASLFLLTACETTYSFEADPEGKGGSENYEGDPTKIVCFYIEADGPTDEEDIDLGKFCKER
jgi:hypothetical protein